MIKRFIRAIFTLIGGLLGYELFELVEFIVEKTQIYAGEPVLSQSERAIAISFFVIIFAFIFFRYAPNLTNRGHRMATSIENEIQGVSPVEIIGGAIGLVLGLVVAYLLSTIYQNIIVQKALYLAVTIAVYAVLAFFRYSVSSPPRTTQGPKVNTSVAPSAR